MCMRVRLCVCVCVCVCSWIRICRPGSIIGPQQHFLEDMQNMMWRDGERYRKLQKAKQTSADSLSDGMAMLNLGSGTGTWIEAVDSVTGRKYYYNSHTKQTRWDNPEKKKAVGAASAADIAHHTGVYVSASQCVCQCSIRLSISPLIHPPTQPTLY